MDRPRREEEGKEKQRKWKMELYKLRGMVNSYKNLDKNFSPRLSLLGPESLGRGTFSLVFESTCTHELLHRSLNSTPDESIEDCKSEFDRASLLGDGMGVSTRILNVRVIYFKCDSFLAFSASSKRPLTSSLPFFLQLTAPKV